MLLKPKTQNPKPKTQNPQRNLARFLDALPFKHLLESVSKLLSENGSFSIILPFKEEANFIALASEIGLSPSRILHVKGYANSAIKRSLIEFIFQKNKPVIKDLTIEISRHNYTKEYIHLTKDFYLKM